MSVDRSTLGKVMVFTGLGKSKTTAAVGQAVRSAGHGLRVRFIQFLKQGYTGERFILEQLPQVKFSAYGSRCRNWEQHEREIKAGTFQSFCRDCFKPYPEDAPRAREGLAEARRCLSDGSWDLVVLDELTMAIKLGHLKLEEVLSVVGSKAKHTELIITGRFAPQALLEKADLVTEMRAVKHYFNKGFMARKGIEF